MQITLSEITSVADNIYRLITDSELWHFEANRVKSAWQHSTTWQLI